MERKIWSRLPIRPAVLALRRVPMPTTTSDAQDKQGCRPDRDPADRRRRNDQRSEDERAGRSDGSGDAACAPEPIVPGKRARQQSKPDRSAEVRRRERIDERANRVASRDLSEAGGAFARSQADSPAGRRSEQAKREEGRCGDDPGRLHAGQVADCSAEGPAAEPGHADHDACGHEEAGTYRVATSHRPKLTERELVEEPRLGVLADHVTHAIGTK